MNKTLPLVSIIIPVFNRGKLIRETLNSIINQTHTNWECIIVDDGSTDNTKEVVNKYKEKDNRFQYYQRPDNMKKGANFCRNYGFDLSNGKYINWFDSDDLMHEDFLKEKITIAEKGKYDFVSCELRKFKENDKNNSRSVLYNYRGNLLENYFCNELSFFTPGPLWKKYFLMKNNLKFDEESKVLNDWVFNIEALFITKKYFLLKKELIFYREHEGTISRSLEKYNKDIIYSEFLVRKKINKKYLDKKKTTKKIRTHYFNRNIFLLKSLLIVKDYRASKILIHILKYRFFEVRFLIKKIKISLGFLSFYLFNKGYVFFK